MSIAKKGKNVFGKILKISVVFVLVFAWIYSGSPQILDFPPKIQEARAGTVTYDTAAIHVWHSPVGVTSVDVECWGAGAAGGGGDTNGQPGGGGGGGGAYAKTTGISINADTDYNVVVGAGGNGGTGNGLVGEDSYFDDGTQLKAKGGTGGLDRGNGGTGGAGGTGSTYNSATYDGGAGAAGADVVGGGGGESAGAVSVGTPATGQTGASGVVDGGDGGNGGNAGVVGSDGVAPGGAGGGGGQRSGGAEKGGSGAVGKCILTWTVSATSTLSTGTDPEAATIAPGASETDVNLFVITTSSGTEAITEITVNLSIPDGIARLSITDSGDSELGFTISPSAGSNAITIAETNAVTEPGTTFKVRITPDTHGDMDPPAGAEYAITAPVTAWNGGNTHDGSDDNNNALTIDNLSTDNTTVNGGSAGDAQVTINYTNSDPVADDLHSIIVLRRAIDAVADNPVEGTTYTVGISVGSATVACVDTSVVEGGADSCTDTNVSNDTAYHYEIFAKDENGNYATGVVPDGLPFTPSSAPTLSFSIVGIADYAITFGDLNVSAPRWAGDSEGSNSESSAHTLTAATNSSSGYSITVKGDTLKYSSYDIEAIGNTPTNVSTGGGTEQFGIRITSAGDNCAGSQVAPYNGIANMYGYNATASAEDEIVSCSSASTTTTYSMHYAANVSALTEAGDYTATLIYICTGNF